LCVCPFSDGEECRWLILHLATSNRDEERLLNSLDPGPRSNTEMRSKVCPVNGKIRWECGGVAGIRLFAGGEQRPRRRCGAFCADPSANLPNRITWIASQGGDTNAVLRCINLAALRFDRHAVSGAQVRERGKGGTRPSPTRQELLSDCVFWNRRE
jgi:hypothetical protein